ncbi:MAG: PssD/Cps14F family polysaccharide biosynthesis glycosyltransferase [Microcystaceae cyanobacterium]
MKILLVCSSGGHFKALEQLNEFWSSHERSWITFETATTSKVLQGEKVHWAFSPTNRNLPNLLRNLGLAWQIVRREKPEVILTTGAGVAVPFILVGKLVGSQTVFIESITRIQQLSLSARLVLPFLDIIYVQWPQLKARYPQAELISL